MKNWSIWDDCKNHSLNSKQALIERRKTQNEFFNSKKCQDDKSIFLLFAQFWMILHTKWTSSLSYFSRLRWSIHDEVVIKLIHLSLKKVMYVVNCNELCSASKLNLLRLVRLFAKDCDRWVFCLKQYSVINATLFRKAAYLMFFLWLRSVYCSTLIEIFKKKELTTLSQTTS
jgi:hypothetical protein